MKASLESRMCEKGKIVPNSQNFLIENFFFPEFSNSLTIFTGGVGVL